MKLLGAVDIKVEDPKPLDLDQVKQKIQQRISNTIRT